MKRLLLSLIVMVGLTVNANAVTCYWVGGTGTWNGVNTTSWASGSGGTGGTCGGTGNLPGAGDDAIFDGSSGGGTVTVNTTVTLNSLTMSAFTGTLDFATNNNNVTLSASTNAFVNTGSGTRTLNMGNGTWTLSGAQAIWSQISATNLTFNANGSTIAFTGTASAQREFRAGTARTYNNVTVNSSVDRIFKISATTSVAFNTLTFTGPNRIVMPTNITSTVTTLSNISGNSTNQVLLIGDNPGAGPATISSANNFTCDYCGISGMTFSGGGTFAGTNSFNLGGNSGITITPPTGAATITVGGFGFR